VGDSHKSKSQQRTLVNEDFRSNHEAVFGEKKPARGKWIWDKERGEMVPASEYVPPAPDDGRVMVVSDLYMDGVAAPDGTDIGSRPKRREYMRRNNVTDADDFKGTWAKAAKDRAEYLRGEKKIPGLREALGRALYAAETKRRK
jgi:hypothetical protein